MKKKLIVVALFICMIAGCLAGCGSSKEKLKIFLPGEYLGENVIENFEKQYNCKVIVENFDSNEAMYTKFVLDDTYDVLIPSDYMIERLLNEKYLQPIDKSVITNLSKLAKEVQNMDYDKDNTYSVPYFWGTVGLVYNKNKVDYNDLVNEGFGILKDQKYKGRIYMYDSERDAFMIALKDLGYSANTSNEEEIMAAYDWLYEVMTTMDAVAYTDQVIDNMAHGSRDIALVYSGDAATVISENEEMSYFMPSYGTNIWCDAMVIPKNAKNPELANKFINYMLSNEACLDGTETVGYASPNAEVLAIMTGEDGAYKDNPAYYPVANEKNEVYHDNEYLRKRVSELWIKLLAK